MSSSLPPEIITDILCRLPVKYLLRFRCVSKPWCAQIDGSYFVNLHLTRSIATGSNLSAIVECQGKIYSLDPDSVGKLVIIETPFTNSYELTLFNSCNGLLFLRTEDPKQRLILLNPSTRKHCVLPDPPPLDRYDGLRGVLIFYRSHCLGYDELNDDYKVFIIFEFRDKDNNSVASEAAVYSLKSNSWRKLRDFYKGIKHDQFSVEYVNGALHTVNCENPRSVVAFDIGKEAFNLIPMPKFRDTNVSKLAVHVFDGCLAVFCQYPDCRTDIWIMKEYGVKESWSMLLSVKQDEPRHIVLPIVYSKSRDEVLLSYHNQKLVWYELRKKTVRDFQVRGFPGSSLMVICVGSLVSVGGPGKTGEKKQQGEEKLKEEKGKKKRDDFLSKGFKLKL